jgi:tetratricopeptide (TPR) repeat protein/tRNA A-37 threonylcarbamoyl transferase component Bud32
MTDSRQRRSLVPRITGYRILKEIGRGGMGVVYKARHRGLQRLVALKVLHHSETLVRFRNEAIATARLQHPNIVQIFEENLDPPQGPPYICMELIEGVSLAQAVSRGQWVVGSKDTSRRAAELVETLARAIHYAHQQNVAHRDLKPANILLQRNQTTDCTDNKDNETANNPCHPCDPWFPKITDFGLAKLLDRRQHLTQTGSPLGTLVYMAPEQATARPGTQWHLVDVYGLGAILYELLTGGSPFRGASEGDLLHQVLEVDPVPPRRLQPNVPRDLETICLKCLEKDPRRRYPNAAAMADDLARFLHGQAVSARPVGTLGRGWRWCRRKPALAVLTAALLLAVLGGLGGIVVAWRNAVAARQEAEDGFLMLRQVLAENLRVSRATLLQGTGGQPLRQDMLTRAEAAYLHLLQQRPGDVELQTSLADVLSNLGTLAQSRGRSREALALHERARQLWEALPPAEAARPECRVGRANSLICVGRAHQSVGHLEEALGTFRQGHDLWTTLAAEMPNLDYEQNRVTVMVEMVSVLDQAGRRDESRRWAAATLVAAEQLAARAPAHPLSRQLLIQALWSKADQDAYVGDWDLARQGWERALPLARLQVEEFPEDPDALLRLAETCRRLIRTPEDAYHAETVQCCEHLRRLLAERIRAEPAETGFRRQLVQVYQVLGERYDQAGQSTEATAAYRSAVEVLQALEKQLPDEAWVTLNLADIWVQLLISQRRAGQADAAAESHRQALAVLGRMAPPAQDASSRIASAIRLVGTGTHLRKGGAPAAGLDFLDQALRLFQEQYQDDPAQTAAALWVSRCWYDVAKGRWHAGSAEAALAAFREAVAIRRRVFERAPEVEHPRREFSDGLAKVAYWFIQAGERGEAAAYYREQEALWPNDADELEEIARDWGRLAEAVSDGRAELSAEQQREWWHYLEQSARVANKAASLRAARQAGDSSQVTHQP